MKNYWLLFTCLLTCNAYAQEQPQRIRDLSLSVEDTMKQPSSSGTTHGNDAYQQYLGQNAFSDPQSHDLGAAPASKTSRHFMDSYCDPNFQLAVDDPSIRSCFEQQRQKSCEQFSSMPDDVKLALNDAIDCAYEAHNGDTLDPNAAASCEASDARRMQLLKRYWQDQNVSYHLVFLPDTVLDASSQCRRGH